jgi:hypothetical protein
MFDRIIFMGNEDCINQISALKTRLDEGLTISSWLQQPPHSTSKKQAKNELECTLRGEEDLKDIIRDITMSLLGKKITFSK